NRRSAGGREFRCGPGNHTAIGAPSRPSRARRPPDRTTRPRDRTSRSSVSVARLALLSSLIERERVSRRPARRPPRLQQTLQCLLELAAVAPLLGQVLRHEVPGEELVESALLVAGRNGLKGGLHIGVRLYTVELAGADQRGKSRPAPAALVVASEECILAVKGQRT